MRRTALLVALLISGIPVAVMPAGGPAAATCVRLPGDFDADGHADVVIGQPGRTVSTAAQAGAFNAVRGSAAGLTTLGDRFADENDIGGALSAQAFLGMTSTTGYFDDDCYADAAVGAPAYDNGFGAVAVFHGSPTGLDTAHPQLLLAADHAARAFGASLTTGDFNHDGRDDLGIGAPSSHNLVGQAYEYFGSSTGITAAGALFFTEDTPGVPGTGGVQEFFGGAVAAGDFDADGYADLAVSAPGESVDGQALAGSVTVLKGSATGLTGTGSTVFTQHTAGVPGVAEQRDIWGGALAAGDVTGDGRADLLVGDPTESTGAHRDDGTVTLLKGSAAGVTATGAQLWSQDSPGVPGAAESGDDFGSSLAVGDFDGDGHGDAAIGVPGEDLGATANAGTVDVLYGRASGLTATGAQAWSQSTAGIAGAAETNDDLGESLQAVRIAGPARSRLVIGVPSEDSAGFADNGAVAVLPGGAHGLTATGSQFLDAHGLTGGAQAGAHFSGATIP